MLDSQVFVLYARIQFEFEVYARWQVDNERRMLRS